MMLDQKEPSGQAYDVTDNEMDVMKQGLLRGEKFEYTSPETGIYILIEWCPEAKKVKVHKRMPDTSPILLKNQQVLAENKTDWKGDYHNVARIPYLGLENYCQARGITQQEFMSDRNEWRKMLNDSENIAFRTKKGVL